MQIDWTVVALRDLRAARSYIATKNPGAAGRQFDLIFDAIDGLAQFPESGRPGRLSGKLELVIGMTPYIVAYFVKAQRIQILRILHGRRLWPEEL